VNPRAAQPFGLVKGNIVVEKDHAALVSPPKISRTTP
jgi:hypothetical protein